MVIENIDKIINYFEQGYTIKELGEFGQVTITDINAFTKEDIEHLVIPENLIGVVYYNSDEIQYRLFIDIPDTSIQVYDPDGNLVVLD